jgi:Ran-binding protein 3
MADNETAKRSATPPERINPEDPETAAARKELNNTAISEKPDAATAMELSRDKPSATSTTTTEEPLRASTPPPKEVKLQAPDGDLTEQVSSPKKKRAHDEVEDPNPNATKEVNGDVSPIAAAGSVSASRTDRLEPEKKRHRDISSEVKNSDDGNKTVRLSFSNAMTTGSITARG